MTTVTMTALGAGCGPLPRAAAGGDRGAGGGRGVGTHLEFVMSFVREYCREGEHDGRDDGGFYRMVEKPDLSIKLQQRMLRCRGCHDDFYNRRANCSGNHCWSLTRDENFDGRGRPKCWH